MRYICKTAEPDELRNFKRNNPTATYRSLSEGNGKTVKQLLRESLLEEQGKICCYCGKKINSTTGTIEHVKCKQMYPQHQLDYHNLLCSCDGGEKKRRGNPIYPMSCGHKKDNRDIPVSPLVADCSGRFSYNEDGNVYGADADATTTIEVLNLNHSELRAIRKSVLVQYKAMCGSIETINGYIEMLAEEAGGDFTEFCFVIDDYLKKQLELREG